jgi:hypothetical protein
MHLNVIEHDEENQIQIYYDILDIYNENREVLLFDHHHVKVIELKNKN